MGCDSSGFFSLFNGQSAQCGPVNNQIQQMRANLDQITTNLERLRDTVGPWHFYTGMIKAPVFGAVITTIGCFEGLQVHGSADSGGQLTTRSVVESIFCVIVLDAIFSIIFLLANV